jgi:RimJ/RimL family protein N-acetyltransferase
MILVAETPRLCLRWLEPADVSFILALLNEPGWLRFIGQMMVKTEEDALSYLHKGPLKMYQERGFGLYGVALKSTGELSGLCGLIKRPTLPDVDLGFAFLARYCGQGYAFEAAQACVALAREQFGLARLVAITDSDNRRSIQLLTRLGMVFETQVQLTETAALLDLFALNWPAQAESGILEQAR